jgi:hypothetical protein
MAYTTIDDPSAYFHTQLYTGSSSGQSITNDANAGDFKPDWVWIKRRDGDPNSVGNGHHSLYDSSRGVQKEIYSDLNSAEATNSGGLTAFGTDGFTVGTEARVNSNGLSFVSWQWVVNGGTTASNTDGSITSTVQANTTAGFSIVTYTGTATGGATIGHGLGVAPKAVFTKTRAISDNWLVYHAGIGATKYLTLNTNSAEGTNSGAWNDTAPSSTVVTLGSFDNSNDNNSMVAYCFAEKQGYSKFGSYTGNGNADGAFVYTGFKPAWIMIKQTDGTGSWAIHDTKRGTINPIDEDLFANLSSVESDNDIEKDILSNGFKLRASHSAVNGDGNSYIYMAFAESPFVSSEGVPTTAR